MADFTIHGIRELARRLDAMNRKAMPAAAVALRGEAADFVAEMEKITPVDTGELVGAFVIGRPEVSPRRARVKIVNTAPHAASVHEDTAISHEIGESHFMIKPLLSARARGGLKRFADAIKRARVFR